MIHYLDSSAAAKLLVEDSESNALASYLEALDADQTVLSSALLETELRRFAIRESLDQSAVTLLLATIDLVDPPRSIFHEAGLLPGLTLRSLDALHLATALRVSTNTLVSYDLRLLSAAETVGLSTVSPS